MIPVLSFTLGTGQYIQLPNLSDLNYPLAAYITDAVFHFTLEGMENSVQIPTCRVVFLATTVFTNIFCTFAIIHRFISISGFSKSFKTYHGILEIVIESSVLYTSIYLIQIGLYVYSMYFADECNLRFYYAEALANVVTVRAHHSFPAVEF